MGEETGGLAKLDNNENYYLCSSVNIIRGIKTTMTRWVGHVDCLGNCE